MSLINDALKKAENIKTRSPGTTPAFPRPNAGSTDAAALSYEASMAISQQPRKSKNQGLVLAMIGGFFLLACGVFGVGVYLIFFRGAAETVVAKLDTTILETPAATPAAPPPAVETPVAQTTPVETAAVTQPTATATTPVATAPAPTSTIDKERLAAVSSSTAATGAEPNPAISDWVAGVTITGVRTGERSKVLMNNRVYMPGDVVNYDFELKLTDVTPNRLTFSDPNGATYHLDL
jgi:hypothetical protein